MAQVDPYQTITICLCIGIVCKAIALFACIMAERAEQRDR